jgi:hypothetical protein
MIVDPILVIGLIDTSRNVVVVVPDQIEDHETLVLPHLALHQIHLAVKPGPLGLTMSLAALSASIVSLQESRNQEESASSRAVVREEGAQKEIIDMMTMVHHRILMIVIHMLEDHPDAVIRRDLEIVVGRAIGHQTRILHHVAMEGRFRQLHVHVHMDEEEGRDTRILNQTPRTIVTQQVRLQPLVVDAGHVPKEETGVEETPRSLQPVVARRLPKKVGTLHQGAEAQCQLLLRTRRHGGKTPWFRLAHVLHSLPAPRQQ